jgi:hypothetical protein
MHKSNRKILPLETFLIGHGQPPPDKEFQHSFRAGRQTLISLDVVLAAILFAVTTGNCRCPTRPRCGLFLPLSQL